MAVLTYVKARMAWPGVPAMLGTSCLKTKRPAKVGG